MNLCCEYKCEDVQNKRDEIKENGDVSRKMLAPKL